MVLHLSADNAESAYMDQEPIKTRVGPDFPDLHKHTVEHSTVSEKTYHSAADKELHILN